MNPEPQCLGMEVRYDFEDHSGIALVIGLPFLDVYLLATADGIGMPINCGWCEPTGRIDKERAREWRNRYSNEFPLSGRMQNERG